MGEIYISTTKAAKLEGISRQMAHKKASAGDWIVKIAKIGKGGKSGMGFLIALSSLSSVARQRYCQNTIQEVKENQELAEVVELHPPVPVAPLNLAEIEAKIGKIRFEKILADADEKAAICEEALDVPDGSKKTQHRELVAAKYGISTRTLYGYIKEYQEGGRTALIRKLNGLGRETTRRTVSEELERVIRSLYLQPNKPKVSHVYDKVKKLLERESLEVPSRATIYRVVEDLNKYEPDLVCLAREGPEAYMKKFAIKATRSEPQFMNEVWEGDHHRLDVFIKYNGRPVRPWMTAWLDVATRTIIGYALSIQANGRTIALAMRHGILPKVRSGWEKPVFSKPMAKSIGDLGWGEEELLADVGETLPIFGVPKTIYIDNGEDYKSQVKKQKKSNDFEYSRQTRSVCDLLNINPMFATPYAPYAKGHMERWFGTFTDRFARYLPGYCGKDNKQRPYNLDEKKMAAQDMLLELDELNYLMEVYLHQYHNTVHSSLGMTPLQKVAITPKVTKALPDARTLDICLMDNETAVIQTSGIEKFGSRGKRRWFHHPDLDKLVGQKVVIRYDPNRIGEILVFSPRSGKFLCTATNKELLAWGATRDDLTKFQKQRASLRKELREQLKGIRKVSLDSLIKERKQAGSHVLTGKVSEDTPQVQLMTGMEPVAKQRKKKATKETQDTGKTKPKKKTNIFDEMLLQAGS
ncbi:Mu transposase C-terminal domain-containing protein [Desulforamulus ruminis]|uniref:Transposase-like Mu n=1 Tax=Desulforamulus ruminis (strain ATCC 23193 / DSM 2154 / NCIMB 8452 / DL) TaxID=696281 RepID=F6DTI1_DESRL|nr:Mu transposase C-terminal domain-containing protein [Desulforamulus ruminis]AEG60043.1 Transposase-like Mu [Desulforamulus ruminis DSM 2154]